ncbi:ring-cleaving dioxygenase [Ferruginibacter paludis]|uniref:ring-cleaving dioxygenase n=1 Tax=Ferruginibacter paludis TaxID=1310417 RepID=UPI0025B39620|nr:ring-cleaving dioxygenase [Ferruginibacter paludis]MDN3656081.1 ring-cleaving dioxygenase [Ferruginibacter paludis]
MSNQLITGIHHITALASDPQKNLDFYAGILGLRLVKKTINFDAPDVYHLYYGNETGAPGTILTFFPYPTLAKGRKGKGQVAVTSFSIPETSLEYWMKRLTKFNIKYNAPDTRYSKESFIYFEDPDGLGIELVANKEDFRPGSTYGQIPLEHSVKGFYGVTLAADGYEKTAGLLTAQMDHQLIAEKDNRFRYSASGKPGDFVDIICSPDSLRGLGGSGTIHHIAFATADDSSQLKAREKLVAAGFNPTLVLDREYFHSIYFREPGGVLFEIATVPPGFSVDEEPDHLGESLKLPAWYEPKRYEIENVLQPIQLNKEKFED